MYRCSRILYLPSKNNVFFLCSLFLDFSWFFLLPSTNYYTSTCGEYVGNFSEHSWVSSLTQNLWNPHLCGSIHFDAPLRTRDTRLASHHHWRPRPWPNQFDNFRLCWLLVVFRFEKVANFRICLISMSPKFWVDTKMHTSHHQEKWFILGNTIDISGSKYLNA